MPNKIPPKYLNLFVLGPRMSITAKTSILHRLSGIILVLAIPFVLYVLKQSLVSSNMYDIFSSCWNGIFLKVVVIILLWGLVFHICSGIRFLLLDINKGMQLKTAKLTAVIVISLSIIITLGLSFMIW